MLKNEVRLIGGTLTRSRLPVADRPGLRPTPERVRETLFNWLGHDLSGWRVLDAYAGSGALGFEAASRGAAQVVLLENDAVLVTSLRASRERLGANAVRIERTDAISWMNAQAAAAFDLVLLDPPFNAATAVPAAAAAAVRLLSPGGFLYLETPAPLSVVPDGLSGHRAMRAGAVCATLLQRPV